MLQHVYENMLPKNKLNLLICITYDGI